MSANYMGRRWRRLKGTATSQKKKYRIGISHDFFRTFLKFTNELPRCKQSVCNLLESQFEPSKWSSCSSSAFKLNQYKKKYIRSGWRISSDRSSQTSRRMGFFPAVIILVFLRIGTLLTTWKTMWPTVKFNFPFHNLTQFNSINLAHVLAF